jgi:ribosome-associated protein
MMLEEPKSKSQKKRDADALQKLGVKLIALNMEKLHALPLSENLRQALIDAKSIKSHGALRRQVQLIGKLMRTVNSEAILDAYNAMLAEDKAQTATFHGLEQWRTRLLNEGKVALTEFVQSYKTTDVQQLRQLVKKAVEEQNGGGHTGAGKALFRFLRSCLS